MYRFALLQNFSKFGKISHLDFLFHKTGMLKGKPRGYAFVQYANKDVSFLPCTLGNLVLTPGTFVHIIMLLVYIHMDEQATRGRSLPPETLNT